jgi:hypothetical protein
MSIAVTTAQPAVLLASIRKAIDNKRIDTWSYDKDGDFTHTPGQWANHAWLRPTIEQGSLCFGLLGQTGVDMTSALYGVYHGRFIEMLLTHFDRDFLAVGATALKGKYDDFK